MKTNLTIADREACLSKILSVAQPDGLWTVYEAGDVLPETPVTQYSPAPVSASSLRVQLYREGLLNVVEAAITASPDPEVSIMWSSSFKFHCDHPMAKAIGDSIGKTDAERYAIWEAAALLEV